MFTVLALIESLIGVALVVAILLQSGKDTGLSGAFGVGGSASAQPAGAYAERNIRRFTRIAVGLFLIIAVVMVKIPA
jgi:preprotein translocase subunit SecG